MILEVDNRDFVHFAFLRRSCFDDIGTSFLDQRHLVLRPWFVLKFCRYILLHDKP